MRGSWRIARIAGIDLSIHWTFGLLLAWVLMTAMTGFGLGQGLLEVLFVLTLFGCVVLHELGHAMAARMYGIPTHGITLLPIGGVAQLERIPRNPWQEWVIALAGPAVNVLIVGSLFPIVALLQGAGSWSSPLAFGGNFLARLMWVNVMLVCFNLLPAFPMDGGRVLRSLLATRSDYVTATRRAKRIGQGVAVLFALLSPWTSPMLLLIAAFVVMAAESEYRAVLEEFRRPVSPPVLPSAIQPVFVESAGPAIRQASPSLVPGYHHILPDGVVLIRALPSSGFGRPS